MGRVYTILVSLTQEAISKWALELRISWLGHVLGLWISLDMLQIEKYLRANFNQGQIQERRGEKVTC